MDLIADIGATHSRCALLDHEGAVLAPETFNNSEFDGVEAMLQAYLARRRESDRPSRAALALAAPILEDHIEMTNLEWSFSQISLQVGLGLRRLQVLNDFEALAWSLLDLDPDSLTQIGRGEAQERGARAVLGPGSGLGVSGLVPHPDGWAAISGEGGHVTLAATTADECDVIDILKERYGHCSAERALSGPGLVNLYHALSEIAGRGMPRVDPDDVTSLALKGEPLAASAMDMFFRLLGTVAADLAVTLGARGGVYITGGIVPQVVSLLAESEFRSRFESKGRYRAYMTAIPTIVVTEPVPAFRGLRRVLGFGGRSRS
ncbi:MAG: glucokinase [Gammaproteobacteria bacterium]|jgi:glucokinase